MIMGIHLGIIGSRTFHDYDLVKHTIDPAGVTHIVSGGAKGADSLAEVFAREHHLQMIIFLPDYKTHGRKAAFVRNTDIITESDRIVAFWDGQSKGTLDSIKKAQKLGKPVQVIKYLETQTLEC